TSAGIWPQTLNDLRLQMPQATFDTWLKGATAALHGDTLTVLVGNPFAQDWLERRLRPKIERAVAGIAGRPLDVVFSTTSDDHTDVAGHSRPDLPPDSTLPAPGPGEIAVELVEFDPAKRGFVMTANYAIRFWHPYLGLRPFALWLTLKSFAFHAEGDARPSIQTLADIVAGGNRYALTGRAACNGRRRQVGALEVLEEERIVWVLRTGEGGKTRYHFRVLDSLPLLTPAQVKRLPGNLQAAHARFIDRCAIDFQEWRQMTLPTLARVSPG
ncbi:MAG: DnaA N-terminal domain-containing protein, partial [Anaerolineae bacterium]